MITQNKGEWSEFYVFLKILFEKVILNVDKNLVATNSSITFYQIIRTELGEEKKIYDISFANLIKILDESGTELKIYDVTDLPAKTRRIFERIKGQTDRTFSIVDAEDLMAELLCKKVKASGRRKEDLVGIINDNISPALVERGFSIKSMIGALPTLLNSSQQTNIVYRVDGFEGELDIVNNITGGRKFQKRLQKIKDNGGILTLEGANSEVFGSNLRRIDTAFSEFIGDMLLYKYGGEGSNIQNLTKMLYEKSEIVRKYKLTYDEIEGKIKDFLDAIAQGMMPGTLWDGIITAHGCIVVKENGDIVSLYDRAEFRDYLFENTYLDTPDSRNQFGTLYREGDGLYFKLNLQVRFLR